MFLEVLNGKSWRRGQIHYRLFAIALSLIVIGKLSASVVRIDGGFEDWKDVKVCAYDPKGDAKGAGHTWLAWSERIQLGFGDRNRILFAFLGRYNLVCLQIVSERNQIKFLKRVYFYEPQ